MVNNLLEAALEYFEQGYSVIPLQPNSKLPLISWMDYTNKRATKELITHWWLKNPNANIGIVTGKISNIVVIDVDVQKGGDAKSVYELAPTNFISQTGSGGYHLVYHYHDEIPKNKVGKDGIDVRSNGGYIVAPPSIHSNGNKYEWVQKIRKGQVTSALISSLNSSVTANNDEGYDKWIADALLGVNHGSRNDTCTRLAGYYAGKGIPKDVATILLSEWNNKNTPPLDDGEIKTTIDSVYRTAYKNNPLKNSSTSKSSDFNVMTFDQYMRTHGDNAVSWIIPDWLPNQTIAFAVSPPGTYKTWMLLDLAISVATGTDFLGQYPVESTGPVIMIQQEDHHGGLAERMGVIANSRYNVLKPNLDNNVFEINLPPKIPVYLHPDRKLRFNDVIIMDKLEEVIKRIKPKLVIIDPLYSAAETDDYMAKSASEMFRLKELRDKYGCAFLIAHHKKKKAENNEREGLWGSQFLNAFLETGWQIRRLEDNTISVLRHFKVKKESNELRIRFDINTENFPYDYKIITDTEDNSGLNIIDVITRYKELTPTELAKLMGVHRSTISRKLKLLESDGVVIKTTEGKYRTLESIDNF